MPGLDGPSFHAALGRRRPGMQERIVFVTGGAFTPDTRAFLASAPNPVVEKPFNLGLLEKLIASAAAKADASRSG
ncbi:MAG: hybrid sensor histidine kinase/response regulator, partial [Myxococcales bacterium]